MEEQLNAKQQLKEERIKASAKAKVNAQGMLLRHAAFMGTARVVALLGPSRKAPPDTPDAVRASFWCGRR
jgi:hypothetical protein